MMFNILLILLTYRMLIYAADPRLTSTHSRHRISKRDLEIEKVICYTNRGELNAFRRHDYEELWAKEVVPWERMVPRLYPNGSHHDLSFYFQWATPLTRVWVLFYPDMAQDWRERYFLEDAQVWLIREIKLSVLAIIETCVIKEKHEGYFNYQSHPFHFLVSLGKPSAEIMEIYTQLNKDMLSASHLDDIPQVRHPPPAHHRRQMASQQPPPPIPPRPPPASLLPPSSDRPRTTPAADPKPPGPGQASNDPRWPGSASRQDSLDPLAPFPLDEMPSLSPAASGTLTAGLNFGSGKPLTTGKPQARNGRLQPRVDGPQTTSGIPQPPNGGPQPPNGGPQPQESSQPPSSPQQVGQGSPLQAHPLQGLSKPPLPPPNQSAGKQEFPLPNGSESPLMLSGNPPVARPLFPPTGEPSPGPDGTPPVASALPQGQTGPPTADIRQSSLYNPLYVPGSSAAPSPVRITGTSETARGWDLEQGGSSRSSQQGSWGNVDQGAGSSRSPQQGSWGNLDPGAGTSRSQQPGSAGPGSARRLNSVDFHDWQGTPFENYGLLDTLPTTRRPASRGPRRTPSHNLSNFPDTPFRTSDTVPGRPPAHRAANPLRGSSFEFSFPAPGRNTGQFMDTTALHERYGRLPEANSGENIGRNFRSPFLQSTAAPITVEGVGDVQTTPENALRLLRPATQQMDRGTSPGDQESDRLLESQALSDDPNHHNQEVSVHGGVGYAPPPGTPLGTPRGTPSETAESQSQARRRGKKTACFYWPPYRTPLDRLREEVTTSTRGDATPHRGDMTPPRVGTPPPGSRHPPGVEEVTGDFLGTVAKFCGCVWTCPCASVAFCCHKFNCPERCGQAYSTIFGESCARGCRDNCPDSCQPEQCASLCRECGEISEYCQDAVAHPQNRACVTCVSGWCCLATTMTCTQVLAPWIIRWMTLHGHWLRPAP